MTCLKRPLIAFVFSLRPGRRSACASEVGVTTGAHVVLLAPGRTEQFPVLARCHEARAAPTRYDACDGSHTGRLGYR